MLIVKVDDEVQREYSELHIVWFEVYGLKSASSKLDRNILDNSVSNLVDRFCNNNELGDHPRIYEWQEVYRKQGLKPSRYRSSPEALARRVLRGDDIATNLPIVNVYNAISLNYLTPLGCYDLDRLPETTITLRFARPELDRFEPLGFESKKLPLSESICVYAIKNVILTWGFNYRDSKIACLGQNTNNAAFIGEVTSNENVENLSRALEELRSLFISAGARVNKMKVIGPTIDFTG